MTEVTDKLRKLCEEATPWPKRVNHSGIALDFEREADAEFHDAARTYLPLLLDVVEAASQDAQHYAEGYCKRINEALARLDEAKL